MNTTVGVTERTTIYVCDGELRLAGPKDAAGNRFAWTVDICFALDPTPEALHEIRRFAAAVGQLERTVYKALQETRREKGTRKRG